MKEPFVSIIIPTFNMGKYLANAIDSALAQSYTDFELIIIDDGSTDNTKELIRSYNDQRIKYIYQNNLGVSRARNCGISHAIGKYIAFLDADDTWLPNKLKVQVGVAKNNHDIGLISCGHVVQDINTGIILEKVTRKHDCCNKDFIKCLSCYQIIPAGSSGVFIKKSCLDNIGYFDDTLQIAEDWDLWLRIAKVYDVYFIDDYLVILNVNHAKPGYRNYINEELSVLQFINKTVPHFYKRKSKSALYAYLGSMSVADGENLKAFVNLFKSIYFNPYNILPNRITKQCNIHMVNRYYLVLLAFFPIKIRKYLKKFLPATTY